MPFDPVQIYGPLPSFDRLEFRETGFLTETVSFSPESEIKPKKGHTATALNQTLQVQFWAGNLVIEIKGGIVPDANGRVHGLPASYIGQSITTCAHFAAAEEGGTALERCGYTRDATKLLAVTATKIELGDDAPNCTLGLTYFRHVSKDLIALPA